MRNLLPVLLFALLSVAAAPALAQAEQRTFRNVHAGKVTLQAPREWRPIERHHIEFGTTFYRLVPPQQGEFDLEIVVNDLQHMYLGALSDPELEPYIEGNMAGLAPRSVEGKVAAVRFGPRRDGVYARLTDKAPKPGEYRLLTQGVRLQGKKVVLFTLYSNDQDEAVLRQALDVVGSVRFD